MKYPTKRWPISAVLVLSLAGCAVSGMQAGPQRHLSDAQCRDLTALRNHAPLTRERNASELAALEEAGYRPAWAWDPYYPDDLQAAQRLVDRWYQAECRPAQGE